MAQQTFYHCDASSSSIKSEFQSYFSTGFLCDLKVVSGKSHYNVHRLVLAAVSPFLSQLFSGDETIEQIDMSDFDELDVHSFIYNLYDIPTKETIAHNSVLEWLNIKRKPLVDLPFSIKEEDIEIVPVSFGDDKENGIYDENDFEENHDNEVKNCKLIGHQLEDNDMLVDDSEVEKVKKRGRPKGSVKKGINKYIYERKYICEHCDYKAAHKSILQNHVRSVHEGVTIDCELCDYKATQKYSLQRHVRSVHEGIKPTKPRPQNEPKPDQKPIQCKLCKIVCLTKTELFQHRETAHQLKTKKNKKGNFSCDHCGNLCGRRRDLQYHIKHSCPACTLACPHCPRKFPNTRTLDSHISKLHDPTHKEKALIRKKFICPICGMELRKHVYEYHVASHDPEADLSKFEKFECGECGKKFTSMGRFTRHGCKKNGMVFDDNDGNLMCTLCLDPLKDKKDAILHKKEKHADKFKVPFYGSFICPFPDCDMEKQKISDIKIHLQMVHYRVKRSVCEICFERFETSHMKTKHMIDVHKISSEFQCETCGLDCRSQYGLKDHNYLVHSDERRYKCKYCEKAFKRNSELKRHLFIHESHLSQNVCDVCGKAFRDVSSLKAHKATHTARSICVELQ